MILSHPQKLWRYNAWGWARVWPHLSQLAAAQPDAYFAERPLFWHSLHGVVAHSLAAEQIWLARLQGHSPSHLPSGEDYDSLEAILADWGSLHQRWTAYMSAFSDEQARATVTYHTTSGQPFAHPAGDIIQHVVNHATEHRSQITPELLNLGFATPPLDYILFCRETA